MAQRNVALSLIRPQGPFLLLWIDKIRILIYNYIFSFIWDVIPHLCPILNNYTAIEVMAWMNNYIPLFYVGVIQYPFPNPIGGWANLC